ncbi:MAG: hypothetical protein AAF438_13120 [Pseudomonadota bacterium]
MPEEVRLIRSLNAAGILKKMATAQDARHIVVILELAYKLCIEEGPDQLDPTMLSKNTNLPVQDFSQSREAVIRALIVRMNLETIKIVEELTQTSGFENWLSQGSEAWDDYIGLFFREIRNWLNAFVRYTSCPSIKKQQAS